MIILVVILILSGNDMKTYYFPAFKLPKWSLSHVCFYIAYAIFIHIPVLLEIRENIRWKWREKKYFG